MFEHIYLQFFIQGYDFHFCIKINNVFHVQAEKAIQAQNFIKTRSYPLNVLTIYPQIINIHSFPIHIFPPRALHFYVKN